MKMEEIKISVPWGFIAAKTWGDEKDEPVVALHGYKDNANTFDNLIPLLPKSFYYISVDIPSHGKSTQLSTDTFPTHLDYLLSIKLTLEYLDRKKYILMGHSFGGRLEIIFTQMYPEYISMLIMLDASYFAPIEAEFYLSFLKNDFESYSKQLQRKGKYTAPTYNFEEAVQRLIDGRFSAISEDSAKMLIQRVLLPVENEKYNISTAQHLNYHFMLPASIDDIVEFLRLYPITCPHLLVMAEEGESDSNEQVLKELEKNKKYEIHIVEGKHDVHMDHPERVAPIISKFLSNNYISKL